MSQTPSFSTHLTSHLVRFWRTSTILLKRRRGAAAQTSPSANSFISVPHLLGELTDIITLASYPPRVSPTVFQLPYEIFQEIFSYLPALPWTEMYHRHLSEDEWSRPASRMFWERAKTLLALSTTCRTMRHMVLMEAWKVYVMCSPKAPVRFRLRVVVVLSQYRVLLGNSHLAACVRYSSLYLCMEYSDTRSDRSKDSGSEFRVRFRQSMDALCRMPHHLTQPPHPRDHLDVGSQCRTLCDHPGKA